MTAHYDQLIRVASRAHIPLSVLYEVTHRCNLGCEHCYLSEGPVGRPRPTREELSLEEIRRILDQLAEAGTMFLTLSGGEVFLRRDALDIVAHARSRGLSVTVFTTPDPVGRHRSWKTAEAFRLKRSSVGTPSAAAMCWPAES